MDKTSVCGTDAPGSTPGESTHSQPKHGYVLAVAVCSDSTEENDGGGIQDERSEGLSPSRVPRYLLVCEE